MRPESKHLCVCVCTHACVWLMTLSSSTLTELPFSSLGIALELLGYRVIIFIPYKKVEVSVNANQAFRLLLSGITFSKLKWKKKKKVKKVKWKSLSHIQLFVTPWTIQPTEFSRPEYWGGWSFPSPGDLPNLRIKPKSPALQVDSLFPLLPNLLQEYSSFLSVCKRTFAPHMHWPSPILSWTHCLISLGSTYLLCPHWHHDQWNNFHLCCWLLVSA